MEDNGLKQKLAKNARKSIEEGSALQKLIEEELKLYLQLVTRTATARRGWS